MESQLSEQYGQVKDMTGLVNDKIFTFGPQSLRVLMRKEGF